MNDLFRYDTAAIIHICKNFERFVTFKSCTKSILHGDTHSLITDIGTVVLQVNTVIRTKSVKLNDIAYVSGFHFNLISVSELENLGYCMNGINKRLVNQKGHIIAFLYLLNDMYSMENPATHDLAMAAVKSTV